jgi:zona occludens toxin (predicted ATPase)
MIENPNWVKDGIIAIDEAQTFVDCRMAASKKNRLFSYIMLQGRKRKIDIIMTTQQLDNVDIRIRRNLEHLYECKALVKDEDGEKKRLRPATAEEIEGQMVDLVHITFTDYTMGRRMKMLFNPHPMFKLYDSDEFVDIIE